MNTLVIFDSQFGNTEKIARQIGAALSEFGQVRVEHVNQAFTLTLRDVDLLIVGGPTQAWGATGALKNWLAHLHPDDLERVVGAEFDTRFDKPRWLTGSAAVTIEKQLKQHGATLLLPPESFFVQDKEGPLREGELERATEWARRLHDEYERQAKLVTVAA